MWDTYSPLWYTLANLETWDTYLKSLRPRPNAPPAPSQMEIELGRRYMAEMKKRQQKPGQAVARESLAYSRRIPVCLREISPESLKQEFPVVSRATGKLLADLLVLVSNRRGPPLSPAADPTMIPAAEPQFLIDRTLSFGAAKVILPTVVDRMTTAGLWRLYCLDQWDEIQNYFKLAGQVAEKASATRGGVGGEGISRRTALIGQHARLMTTMAALFENEDRVKWLLNYIDFDFPSTDPHHLIEYQRQYLQDLNNHQLGNAAGFLHKVWPLTKGLTRMSAQVWSDTSARGGEKTATVIYGQSPTKPDGPTSGNNFPFLNEQYTWLKWNGFLYVAVPSLAFRDPNNDIKLLSRNTPADWPAMAYHRDVSILERPM